MIRARNPVGKTSDIVGSPPCLTGLNYNETSLPSDKLVFQAGGTYRKAALFLKFSWVNIPEISLPSQGVYYIHTPTGVGVYVIPVAHHARPPPFGQVSLSPISTIIRKVHTMTLEYIKPSIPDYLTEAMRHAAATLEEGGRIGRAREDVKARQQSIALEIQAQEEALGDLEAESLLKGKPDNTRIARAQEKLDTLRAEQRKLQAAEKSLLQKDDQKDQAIIDACNALLEARRQFGIEMLNILDAELRRHCDPIQHILHVARTLYVVWDHSALRNRYEDANVRTFTDSAALLGHNSYPNYGSPEPAKGSELAAAWQETVKPVRAMMDRIVPTAENIQERRRRQREQEEIEREREERLKPRYI